MNQKLPSLEYLMARRTPAPKTGTGVYFLFQGDQIVYVGQTRSIAERIGQHIKTKAFDSFAWIEVPKDRLEAVERAYINSLRPPLNKTTSGTVRLVHRMPFSERSLWALFPRKDDSMTWDTRVVGLGIRHRQSGKLVYMVRYRDANGVGRKVTLGEVGVLKVIDARKAAIQILTSAKAEKRSRVQGKEEQDAWQKSQKA